MKIINRHSNICYNSVLIEIASEISPIMEVIKTDQFCLYYSEITL